jgi:hypothetical protein
VQLLKKDQLEKIKDFDSINDQVDRLILEQVTFRNDRKAEEHVGDIFAQASPNQHYQSI